MVHEGGSQTLLRQQSFPPLVHPATSPKSRPRTTSDGWVTSALTSTLRPRTQSANGGMLPNDSVTGKRSGSSASPAKPTRTPALRSLSQLDDARRQMSAPPLRSTQPKSRETSAHLWADRGLERCPSSSRSRGNAPRSRSTALLDEAIGIVVDKQSAEESNNYLWHGTSAEEALGFLKYRASSAVYKRWQSRLHESSPEPEKIESSGDPDFTDMIMESARKVFSRRRALGSIRPSAAEAQAPVLRDLRIPSALKIDEGLESYGNFFSSVHSFSEVMRSEKDSSDDSLRTDGGSFRDSGDVEASSSSDEATTQRMEEVILVESPAEHLQRAITAVLEGLRHTRAIASGFKMEVSESILALSSGIMAFLSSQTYNAGNGFQSFTVETFISDDVRRAVARPPEERKESDCMAIHRHLTRARAFPRSLPLKVQRELCKKMTLEVREPGRVVYKQGHYSSSLYTVLTGHICLIRAPADLPEETVLKGSLFTVISELRSGDTFGADEALQESPRSDTAICKERTELLRIDKWDYQEAIDTVAQQEEKEKMELLEGHPMLKTMSVGLNYLMKHTEVVTYPPNVTVFGPDDGTTHVYIIKSGTCRVVRKMKFIKTLLPNNTYVLSSDTTTDDRIRLGYGQERVQELLVVDTFTAGAFFGSENLEIIRNEVRKPKTSVTQAPVVTGPPSPMRRRSSVVVAARPPSRQRGPVPINEGTSAAPVAPTINHAIITNDRCEVLRMPLEDFATIATDETVEYLRHVAAAGPSETDVAKEYLSMREWGVQKKRILRDVVKGN
ncbi:hypothetical protein HDU85_003869 [Gaertneriomyces sp. JEL0708]|nr:hypothetical protein HDU85_003869 [Gaertneriomyces sp. JEL0708]